MLANILFENCPNTEFFLVRIFPKGPEKTLTWTHFTQWYIFYSVFSILISIFKSVFQSAITYENIFPFRRLKIGLFSHFIENVPLKFAIL